jgi:hypothetical protein
MGLSRRDIVTEVISELLKVPCSGVIKGEEGRRDL